MALDAADRRILAVLQADASLTVAEIGRRVGLSASPCWARIQRMERDGVIARRVALVDPARVGLGLVVFVTLRAAEHTPQWLERFASSVSAMPEVLDLYRLAGEEDYLLRVAVEGPAAFDAFYKRLIAVAPMRDVTSRFAMEAVKATTALAIPGGDPGPPGGAGPLPPGNASAKGTADK
jgi:Lrp/AsnC family transcriptional regulator